MGSLRTLLALAVVITHSYGFLLTGGQLSVQFFYVISGFLISYVLCRTSAYSARRTFYLNRFLRIFPVYWAVAAASFAAYLIAYAVGLIDIGFWRTYSDAGWEASLALIASNLAIFGQDWLMFTGVSGGEFGFVGDFHRSEVAVWQGLLITPAWTLGLELTFYLLAPFIIGRPIRLWSLLAFSLAIKAYIFSVGLGWQDPWSYRFFPAELSLFLIGAASQQYLLPKVESLPENRLNRIAFGVTAAIIFGCVIFAWLPMRQVAHMGMIVLGALAMPFLFRFQAGSHWDKKVGELSYPIYIVHMLVIYVTLFALDKVGLAQKREIVAVVAVLGSVLGAFILNFLIADRVEVLRRNVKIRAAARSVDHDQIAATSPT